MLLMQGIGIDPTATLCMPRKEHDIPRARLMIVHEIHMPDRDIGRLCSPTPGVKEAIGSEGRAEEAQQRPREGEEADVAAGAALRGDSAHSRSQEGRHSLGLLAQDVEDGLVIVGGPLQQQRREHHAGGEGVNADRGTHVRHLLI